MDTSSLVRKIAVEGFLYPLFYHCSPDNIFGRQEYMLLLAESNSEFCSEQREIILSILQDLNYSFEEKLYWLRINPADWCGHPTQVHVARDIVAFVVTGILSSSLPYVLDPLADLRSRIGLVRVAALYSKGGCQTWDTLTSYPPLTAHLLRSFLVSDASLNPLSDPHGGTGAAVNNQAERAPWPWIYELLHLPLEKWITHREENPSWFDEMPNGDFFSCMDLGGIGRINVPGELGGAVCRNFFPLEFLSWLEKKGLLIELASLSSESMLVPQWQARCLGNNPTDEDDTRGMRWREREDLMNAS